MTNKELQELLKKYPDNSEVEIAGVLLNYAIRKVHYDKRSMIIRLED